ncbi:MAG: DUF4982 domain-containing protein [Bacteroidales bacterium]|nr:DUF4982 domain-containing protein [Bacteroidales bacterium]
MKHLLALAFALISLCGMTNAATISAPCSPAGFGEPQLFNRGWRFILSDDSAAIQPGYDDSKWQRVQLPHDWGVTRPMSPQGGSCQGYLPGGIGWYRRHLTNTEVARLFNRSEEGWRMYIYFEGIYNRSQVYLNGHLLGYRPSGFASFMYDLTPYLEAGKDNVLAVRVDHSRENDSRWYTGSGIYRPVWLITAPSTHFAQWGTTWKVKSLKKDKAVVEVSVQTVSEGTTPPPTTKPTVIIDILDAKGKTVATKSCQLTTWKNGKCTTSLTIKTPCCWALSDPYLYKIRARLMNGTSATDISESPLGLRTLAFSPDKGFALNGQWMKVKGVCIHDDAGVLGTAVPMEVWKVRLQNLKRIGANAIRMSHNPHAPGLYDLCDSLGLLVMDEASDEWEFPKRKWLEGWNKGTPGYEGTYDYFEEWIDRDVADMVRRDRNHPCIFLWSIGNEVDYPNDPYSHPVLDGNGSDFTQPMYGGYKAEQPNAERIGIIAQRLSKIVRALDDSRAVTGALAGVVMSNATAYPEAVDVVGYNYTESRYDEDHKRYPQRIIYGSENRHDLAAWKAVRDNEHIFGQFLWTGIDYLGESGPWPARGSEAGLLDLAGQIKPNGHYRASLWAEHPVCYIGTYPAAQPNSRNYRGRVNREWISPYATALWNYEEGQHVRVVCYTNAPTARLLLNGEAIGGAPQRDEATDILYWDIEYAAGTLRCEALYPDSPISKKAAIAPVKVGATAEITTCGRPYALKATIDRETLKKQDVAIITVEVVDEEGRLVALADNEITCYAGGGLRLLGMENGDMRDLRDMNGNRCRVKGGRLVAYVTARHLNTGRVQQSTNPTVLFSSPLLKPCNVDVNIIGD